MNYTKEDAIRIVTQCADRYQQELEQRSLLFLCADKHMRISIYEFYFHSYNFLHLTGLKTKSPSANPIPFLSSSSIMSANSFYEKCLSHKLSPNDFEFSDDGTTSLKLDVVPGLITKNLNASMIGDYNSNKPRLYTEKLAGGIKACMGFTMDAISGEYVPNTVLKEDLRNNVTEWVRVIGVFRKAITETTYSEVTYLARKTDWNRIILPTPFAYLSSYLPTTE